MKRLLSLIWLTLAYSVQSQFRVEYTPPASPNVIAIMGDSRTAQASPTTNFWPAYCASIWPAMRGSTVSNFAVGGATLSSLITRYDTTAKLIKPTTNQTGYFILIGGANDLGTGANKTGAETYGYATQIWAKARSDGYLVVASTETGAGTGWPATNTTECANYNALVRSNTSLYDYLIEPDIAMPFSRSDWYIDGIHLTDAGGRALAEHITAVMSRGMLGVNTNYYCRYPSLSIASINTIPLSVNTNILVVSNNLVGVKIAPSSTDAMRVGGTIVANALNAVSGVYSFIGSGGTMIDGNGEIRSYSNSIGTPKVLSLNPTGSNVGVGLYSAATKFTVGGPIATAIHYGGATTLKSTNSTWVCNVDGQTITLPTAASITGRQYTIKLLSPAVSGTVDTTSAQTIDGSASYSLSASNKFVTVQSDGTNWVVIGNN